MKKLEIALLTFDIEKKCALLCTIEVMSQPSCIYHTGYEEVISRDSSQKVMHVKFVAHSFRRNLYCRFSSFVVCAKKLDKHTS